MANFMKFYVMAFYISFKLLFPLSCMRSRFQIPKKVFLEIDTQPSPSSLAFCHNPWRGGEPRQNCTSSPKCAVNRKESHQPKIKQVRAQSTKKVVRSLTTFIRNKASSNSIANEWKIFNGGTYQSDLAIFSRYIIAHYIIDFSIIDVSNKEVLSSSCSNFGINCFLDDIYPCYSIRYTQEISLSQDCLL